MARENQPLPGTGVGQARLGDDLDGDDDDQDDDDGEPPDE